MRGEQFAGHPGGKDATRGLRSGLWGLAKSKGRKCSWNEEEFSSIEGG